MNINEFSDRFDTLLNSYLAGTPFGFQDNGVTIKLDEYEKSLFLTQAHLEVVTGLYSGSLGASFEKVEQTRRYLAPYLRKNVKEFDNHDTHYSKYHSYDVSLPEDCMFIVLEQAIINDETCLSGDIVNVTPALMDELNSLLENPFRGITDKRVLRTDNSNGVTLYSKHALGEYTMVYIKKPSPIILVDLQGTPLSIDGLQTVNECEAVPELHQMILDKAVLNAIQTRFNQNVNNNNAEKH